MKANEATFLRICWGMTAINPSPKSTPARVTEHKARDAPAKTDNGSFVLAVIMMAANCVCHPIQPRKSFQRSLEKPSNPSVLLPSNLVSCESASFLMPGVGLGKTKSETLSHRLTRVHTKGLAGWPKPSDQTRRQTRVRWPCLLLPLGSRYSVNQFGATFKGVCLPTIGRGRSGRGS